jgi:hypothetical protein
MANQGGLHKKLQQLGLQADAIASLVRDRGAPQAKTMREIGPNGGRIGQWLHATPSMTEDAAFILFFSLAFILWFLVI